MPPRGLLARIFGWSEPEKAAVALRGLLAAAPLDHISPSAVQDVLGRYLVRGREARKVLALGWSEALARFLTDGALGEDERSHLSKLAAVLGLSETELFGLTQDTGASAYGAAVQRAMEDGELSPGEWEGLEALKESLTLPDSIREKLFAPKAMAAYGKRVGEVISDERLSPEEQTQLDALAEALHVRVTHDEALRSQLQRYSLYWRIENGEMPSVEAPINLQKGEVAHWAGEVEWHEIRRRTTRVNYSGPTVSIPIMKGVRWRIGSIAPTRMTKDELTPIDSGTLYVTNKRLIFDGGAKNTTLRFSNLLGFKVYSDCIMVDKATGRSPYLFVRQDLELLAVILGAALANSGH